MKYWLLIVLGLMGCQNARLDERFSHHDIPVPTMPGTDAEFVGTDATAFLSAKTLDELFEIEKIVPLENSNDSIVGVITDLIFHQGHWFILDQMTCGVYQFNEAGRFVHRFGRRGSGPGEFEYPKRIRLCFDNHIGVGDPVQGKIHLFDSKGNFKRSTRPDTDRMTIMPRYTFLWNEAQSLVIPAFGSNNPEAPIHAVVDGTLNPYELRFGFGKRIGDIEKAILRGSATRAYTAFEEIDGRYWAGSPFTTTIDIFNKSGELLGQVGAHVSRNREELIHAEDYADVHRKKDPAKFMRGKINRKRGNDGIYQIGDWVFVRMGRYYDVYQKNGQRIAANLRGNNLMMTYGFDQYLVMAIPAGLDMTAMPDGPLKKMLKQNGYDPQDNPFLAIYKLLSNRDLG